MEISNYKVKVFEKEIGYVNNPRYKVSIEN